MLLTHGHLAQWMVSGGRYLDKLHVHGLKKEREKNNLDRVIRRGLVFAGERVEMHADLKGRHRRKVTGMRQVGWLTCANG